jgi:hypothetical protein
MMLKQAGVLLSAFLILISVSILGMRTFSPTFQQCVGAHETNKEKGPTEKHPSLFGGTIDSYVRCTGEFIDGTEKSITALATLIIAAFTCTLWIATSQQGILTREALIADKRAFVFATGFGQFYEQVAGGEYHWRFRPIWRNSGDTPTRTMRFAVACELRNTRLPSGFDFDTATAIGIGLLGPHFESMGGLAPLPPIAAITVKDIEDVQKGAKFLYLYGWVRYRDVFPETPERVTRFCWQIVPLGDPSSFVPNSPVYTLRFDHAQNSEGNCADEECA